MAMSRRRKLCTLRLFLKVFIYDYMLSLLPAFFLMKIPEVIGVKAIFIVALLDLIVITAVNYSFFRDYYFQLMRNKKQYFTYSLLCFALYAAICIVICLFMDYRVAIYLYLPLGLFNFFNIPWAGLIALYFVPMLVTIFIPPYMRRIYHYIFSDENEEYGRF